MTHTNPLSPVYLDSWHREYWATASRYYVAEILQDLWGEWIVKRSWGGLGNRRGNSKTVMASSYEEALSLLDTISKHRTARGYHKINLY
jgi:predicted DNA-binding WGR domain protein